MVKQDPSMQTLMALQNRKLLMYCFYKKQKMLEGNKQTILIIYFRMLKKEEKLRHGKYYNQKA